MRAATALPSAAGIQPQTASMRCTSALTAYRTIAATWTAVAVTSIGVARSRSTCRPSPAMRAGPSLLAEAVRSLIGRPGERMSRTGRDGGRLLPPLFCTCIGTAQWREDSFSPFGVIR
jgi:hypothetical protein